MSESMYPYWGKWDEHSKRCHLLIYHCFDVTAVVHVLIEKDDQIRKRLEQLANRPVQDMLPILLFFAALHDLGKFSPVFQQMLPDVVEQLGRKSICSNARIHHTELGAWFWHNRILQKFVSAPYALSSRQLRSLQPFAEAAFGHHGRPVSCGRYARHFRAAEGAADTFVEQVANLFLQDISWLAEDEKTFSRVSWLFAGLLVLADWVGSSEKWFRYERAEMPLQEYWPTALSQANGAVEESGVLHPRPSQEETFHSLLPNLPADAVPTSLQEYALQDIFGHRGPQLHIFEDLTGSGKTEAALLRAHKIMASEEASGLFFALPTMATANAMYSRMADTYRALFYKESKPSLMLSHSARTIHDDFLRSIALEENKGGLLLPENREESRAECGRWLSDNRKKALLAPCGAGTLDQALLAVLPAKHQCLRLLGLSRTVLIADEIHAYDEYTGKLLQELLTFLGAMGTSVILLTATLTRSLREKFVQSYLIGRGFEAPELESDDFPLATSVSDEGLLEVPLSSTRMIDAAVELTDSPDKMVETLHQAHNAGACACWIRNTVNDAVYAYERLLDEGIPPEDIILFHARFTMADRLNIEQRVLEHFGKESTPETRRGKIVIGTQVLEQSLNIDFDILLTDLAPMDLMIQRVGRCHRFDFSFPRPAGYETPYLLVLSPELDETVTSKWYPSLFPDAQWVYPRQSVLWRTARLLKNKGRIELPQNARELMEGAYGQIEAPEVLIQADQGAVGDERARQTMAYLNALRLDQGYQVDAADMRWDEDVRVPTRLGQDTVRLRLCKVENGKIRLWAGGKMSGKACARSEVPVSAHKVKEALTSDPSFQKELEAFRETMPDQGKYCALLPLSPKTDTVWEGSVLNGKSEEVSIHYSSRTGLVVK